MAGLREAMYKSIPQRCNRKHHKRANDCSQVVGKQAVLVQFRKIHTPLFDSS
jgi:hypothetical protein